MDYSLLVRKQNNMLNKIPISRAEQQAFHNQELYCTYILLIAHGTMYILKPPYYPIKFGVQNALQIYLHHKTNLLLWFFRFLHAGRSAAG